VNAAVIGTKLEAYFGGPSCIPHDWDLLTGAFAAVYEFEIEDDLGVQGNPDEEVVRPLLSGTVDRWAEDIMALGELGIDHVFLQLHTGVEEQDDTMQQLRSLF